MTDIRFNPYCFHISKKICIAFFLKASHFLPYILSLSFYLKCSCQIIIFLIQNLLLRFLTIGIDFLFDFHYRKNAKKECLGLPIHLMRVMMMRMMTT
jgi:hypothetical protein